MQSVGPRGRSLTRRLDDTANGRELWAELRRVLATYEPTKGDPDIRVRDGRL